MWNGALLAFVLAANPTPRPFNGSALLSMCEKYESSKDVADWEAAVCLAYVQGMTDAISTYDSLLVLIGKAERSRDESEGRPPVVLATPLACIPEAATYDQHIRVIVKFLRDHPERLHEGRADLVLSALQAAFPCAPESPVK